MPTRARRRKTDEERESALELLRTQIEDADNLWKQKDEDFYEHRQFYERVINRRELIELDDTLREYSRGIQDLDETLERDVTTNVLLLNLSEPLLDTLSRETSLQAKEEIEECRLVLADSMEAQNPENSLGNAISHSQWVRGVACVEKRWKYPSEPDEDWYKESMAEDYYDPAEDTNPNEESVKARENARTSYFQDRDCHLFTSEHVNMYEMSWWPLKNPTVYLRQFQISYTEARELVDRRKDSPTKGKSLRLADLGKVVFLGESNSPINGDEREVLSKTFDVVIRNHKEGDDWICTEWIKCSDSEWVDGEMYDEYVIPFRRPMYFIIPSGSYDPTATNPHLMYRAPVYPEVSIVYKLNFYQTLLAAMGRMQLSQDFMYIPANKLSTEFLQAAEALGMSIEGAGQNQQLVFKRATPGQNELQVLPGEVLPVPFPEIKTFTDRIQSLRYQREQLRPSRIQTGQAVSAAKEGSATGMLGQKQASDIPYQASIRYQEGFWSESAEAERQAYIFWSEDNEVSKPVYYTASGKEPVMGEAAKPGKKVMVNADKMKRDFRLKAFKSTKTDIEKHQDYLIAYEKKGQGVITEEQMLGELGFPDPQHQLIELQREEFRNMVKAEMAPVYAMGVKVLASYEGGWNIAELPLPTGATPPGGNPAQGPRPNQPVDNQLPGAGQAPPPESGAQPYMSQPGA